MSHGDANSKRWQFRLGSLFLWLTVVALACGWLITLRRLREVTREYTKVAGTITIDGNPLPAGRIILFSGGDPFVGSKVKDGRFELDRVAVGEYRVAIEFAGVPAEFWSEETSTLVVALRPQTNHIDFQLKSK
jgi:hypothetical protein